MQAALLPDRGVIKVAGETARTFLNGLLTADVGKVTPQAPAFAALLTPQGKIIDLMEALKASLGMSGATLPARAAEPAPAADAAPAAAPEKKKASRKKSA